VTRKQRRLYFVFLGMAALGGAAALVLTALSGTVTYFCSPTDIVSKRDNCLSKGQRMRIGGLVENDSVVKDGKTVTFKVTDVTNAISVVYTGMLPDLFREGQGVVVEGRMETGGSFKATEVLAKHDENYMPKEVADALKESGQWNDGKQPKK
jgi:cytochrome c-type biogenesis protein CcmE